MKVVVLGASDNPSRYSNRAVKMLNLNKHEVFPVGIKSSKIDNYEIITSKEPLSDIHTITLYVGVERQAEWYDFILKTKPKRLIFNPGTQNQELEHLAENAGILTIEACTLVMLGTGQF